MKHLLLITLTALAMLAGASQAGASVEPNPWIRHGVPAAAVTPDPFIRHGVCLTKRCLAKARAGSITAAGWGKPPRRPVLVFSSRPLGSTPAQRELRTRLGY